MRISRSHLPAILILAACLPARAQNSAAPDPYTLCAFYPQASSCGQVYQQALTDTTPASGAVRDAFRYYARYLTNPAPALTDQDRAYLTANDIDLPSDLVASDLGGLHNVINDPELAADAEARSRAVNNFINRAVEAEIYCGLSSCADVTAAPARTSGA
ncbi:MAG TPA: hypothetical protein VNW15_01540 [Rhizomicrobium sp.]|jgi:hypothetical protein|nr:hypothetical protein [Rhizomicrobium sp.]